MPYDVEPKKCAEPGCTNTYKPHYWGSVKSADDGWFHEKNDDSWCGEHNPPWVAEWRARRRKP